MCNDYITYLQEYNNKSYEDLSFILRENKIEHSILLTLEKNQNNKILNFFGLPFLIQNGDNDISNIRLTIETLKKIFINRKINYINLVLIFKNINLPEVENLNKKNIKKISIQKFIELDKNIEDIIRKFSKGHKHLINKVSKELNYQIINFKNYKDEIQDMMRLHQEVSGKVTRSKKTWEINEKMILDKKGFIISVKFGVEVISYSFFYFNNNFSEYFSSCTKRNYFNVFKNVTHNSILLAIKYLKSMKLKYFTLGETKILYDKNLVSKKEINICTFKNSFGGEEFLKVYYENFDESIVNILEANS